MDGQADRVLGKVGDALALIGGGRRDEARVVLGELWTEVGATGDALHRLSIAHTLADLQSDPADELVWDLRALEAAIGIGDERLVAAGMIGGAAGLLPSLHLNLADVYVRLSELDRARKHLAAGRSTLLALPDDGYRVMIDGGLDRIEQTINQRGTRITGVGDA